MIVAIEIIEQDVNINVLHDVEELFESNASVRVDLDARRRLEDKIEEMRLRRELKEFDFDD